MERTICTICYKPITDDDYPTTMRLSWDRLNSGTYSDEVCCQRCCTVLSNAISRTIHKVKHDMQEQE
jgi:hypothetical protein